MKIKQILFAALGGMMAFGVPMRAAADSTLGGVIVGGAIVCIMTNCAQPRQQTQRRSSSGTRAPQMSAEQRQQNMDVQNALNYFNYPVGTVDGALGSRSRAAISGFQNDMGFSPADGTLDDYERSFLTGAHYRAVTGGFAPYQSAFQTRGPRGFLYALNDERRGIVPQPVAPVQEAVAPAPVAPAAPAPVAPAVVVEAALAPVAPVAPAPVVVAPAALVKAAVAPPIFDLPQEQRSVAQTCTDVGVQAIAMPEPTSAANVTDAKFALNQQFCMARDFAMSVTLAKLQAMPGETDATIATKCAQLEGWMGPILTGLSSGEPEAVVEQVKALATGAGTTMEALVPTGQLCLGSAYRTDSAKVGAAAALIMVAAGQEPYAEIVGHHLREGFGVSAQPGLANKWYGRAMDALDAGAVPAFLPNQSAERVQIIRRAMELGGNS